MARWALPARSASQSTEIGSGASKVMAIAES